MARCGFGAGDGSVCLLSIFNNFIQTGQSLNYLTKSQVQTLHWLLVNYTNQAIKLRKEKQFFFSVC
jgi:hypothetical protein